MRASLAWVRVGCALAWVGCSSGNAAPPPVFGGEGAVIAGPAKETPLAPASSSAEAPSTDPCAAPSPKGDIALLDDFEDGDGKLFKAFEREGWWFAASDNTEGSRISPLKFAAEKLPEAEATKDNSLAAHFAASGQKDWGVSWGVSLRWESKGIRCPYNASSFAGIRFRARGPGDVRVVIGVPETEPTEGGGTCKANCYDTHGKVVHLDNCWDDYLVRWDQLQQGGWGAQVRFDPARIVLLAFAMTPANLPADFWLDDLALVTAAQADAFAATPAVSLATVNASCKSSTPASSAATAAKNKGASGSTAKTNAAATAAPTHAATPARATAPAGSTSAPSEARPR
jgi:hypothetical protein